MEGNKKWDNIPSREGEYYNPLLWRERARERGPYL